MGSEFVSIKYKKSLKEAQNHVKYIAYRDRTSQEKYGLFNDKSDNVPVKDFVKSLDNKRTSHKDVAKVHTILFSMSGDEWKRSNFIDGDYQTMVRNMMKDWQLEKGITVDWVAAEHNEDGHPHIHVAIKSTFKDSDGVEKRLKIMPEDRKFFKEAFREEKKRIRGFDIEPQQRNFDRSKRLNQEIAGKELFNALVFQIKQRMKENEREIEREKDSMDR